MSFQDLEAGRPIPVRRQQEPSQAVAAGIFQINTAVYSFTRLVGSLGTQKTPPNCAKSCTRHVSVLATWSSRLPLSSSRPAKWIGLRMLVYVPFFFSTSKISILMERKLLNSCVGVQPAKKINDAKLAREFRTSLNEFQKAQRLAAERETMYAPVIPKESLPFSYGAHELETRSSGSSAHQSEQQAFLLQSEREEVVFMDNEIAFNEAIIEERDQGIKEIQQQIIEVNEICKDLAVLVHEQGVMIDDIGSNVENSHAATEQGVNQLAKASKLQRSNSSMSCLLLVIFGIILIIVIIVVVA